MNDFKANRSPRHQQHHPQDQARTPVRGMKNGRSWTSDVQIQCDWTEFPDLPEVDPDASNIDASRRAKKMLTRGHTLDEADPDPIDPNCDKEVLLEQMYRGHLRIENLITHLKDYRHRIEDLRRMKQIREQEIIRLGLEISRLREVQMMGQGREREMQSCILDLRMTLEELTAKYSELKTLSSIREAEFKKNRDDLQRKMDQLHNEKEKLFMSFLAKGGESGTNASDDFSKPKAKREDQPLKLVNRSRPFNLTGMTGTFPLPTEVQVSDEKADDPSTSVYLKQSLKNCSMFQAAIQQVKQSNSDAKSQSNSASNSSAAAVVAASTVAAAPAVASAITKDQRGWTDSMGRQRNNAEGNHLKYSSPSHTLHNGHTSRVNHNSFQTNDLKNSNSPGSLPLLHEEIVERGTAGNSRWDSSDTRSSHQGQKSRGKLARAQTVTDDTLMNTSTETNRKMSNGRVEENGYRSRNVSGDTRMSNGSTHNYSQSNHSTPTKSIRPVDIALKQINHHSNHNSPIITSTSEIPYSLEGKASLAARRSASQPRGAAQVPDRAAGSREASPKAPPRHKSKRLNGVISPEREDHLDASTPSCPTQGGRDTRKAVLGMVDYLQ